MSRRGSVDLGLVAAAVTLAVCGLVFLYSTSSWISERWLESAHGMVASQSIKAVMGLVALVFFSQMDHRHLGGRIAWMGWGAATLLLGVLAWPGGGELTRNSDRWLDIGPIRVQPAEFARVAVVVLLAWLLSRVDGRDLRRGGRVLLWPALAAGVPVLLVLAQPNFGTAVAIALSVLAVAILAGLPFRWLALSGAATTVLAALVVSVYRYPLERLEIWARGLSDWSALPFQIQQGVIALGSGGPLGVGFGASLQKRQFVPDAHTDLILAIIGEELGFAGLVLLLSLFALVIWRGFRVASRAPDRFGYLLAAGLTFQIGLYVIINAGVVTGLLPVTGLPLPFISYGGSALLANLVAVGLIASVSRRQHAVARRPARRVMELGV